MHVWCAGKRVLFSFKEGLPSCDSVLHDITPAQCRWRRQRSHTGAKGLAVTGHEPGCCAGHTCGSPHQSGRAWPHQRRTPPTARSCFPCLALPLSDASPRGTCPTRNSVSASASEDRELQVHVLPSWFIWREGIKDTLEIAAEISSEREPS